MRISKLFGKTLREDPTEAELMSHRLMLRAGMIYQVSSGLYSYLPLAWRSLRKIEQIIREEMDAAGAQEVRLSVLQPRELWDQSGRTKAYGPDLFSLEDRRQRPLVMAPTHEEILTSMVKANVHSYRDLPLLIYQIHTKFRDEPRPRGGLIRVREFDMKDAYSFSSDDQGLDVSYQAMVQAYKNIYSRCGLSVIMVEADSGAIGGKDSHEFVLLADSGEDTTILCNKCEYAANGEKAAFVKPIVGSESLLPLEEIHTPGIRTIEDLATLLKIPTNKTLKAVFYIADGEFFFVTIRGDLEVNEVKLHNAINATDMRLATPEEVKKAGLIPGFASPVGLNNVKTVADDSILIGNNFVVGANKSDYHFRNANYPRDYQIDLVVDIAQAQEGYACPKCNSILTSRRGIEVGHVFKLGTKYSELLGAHFPDKEGTQRPIVMGCYGIGLGRLLAAAIEQHSDAKGIIFPMPIAPFHVALTALNLEDTEVSYLADSLYEKLQNAGVQVLYDDRLESPGVKFNDADLIGLPIRLVVSRRNLLNDVVEIKLRHETKDRLVPIDTVIQEIKDILSD